MTMSESIGMERLVAELMVDVLEGLARYLAAHDRMDEIEGFA